MNTPKTKEIRARELYKLVHGDAPLEHFIVDDPIWAGWLKLGKMVLRLETKWQRARKSF